MLQGTQLDLPEKPRLTVCFARYDEVSPIRVPHNFGIVHEFRGAIDSSFRQGVVKGASCLLGIDCRNNVVERIYRLQ